MHDSASRGYESSPSGPQGAAATRAGGPPRLPAYAPHDTRRPCGILDVAEADREEPMPVSPTILILSLLALVSLWPAASASAQGTPDLPPAGIEVGGQAVAGATWNFDGDIAAGAGPWGSITVTNTSCAAPYRPGTAQAGAVIFTASLQAVPSQSGLAIFQGDLLPFRGTAARGHVQVLTSSGPDATTHVDASLVGLKSFVTGTTLTVCLTGAGPAVSLAQIAANGQQVVARGYDASSVVTTLAPDGQTLIAIAGSRLGSGSGNGSPQWAFFFLGTTYLGTDTAVPSTQLQLAGSPATGQIDVRYGNYAPDDPLCCPSLPPVTITYTWDGTTLVAGGTPPGH